MSLPSPREQRASIRFNHVFPVFLSGEGFGEIEAVARNISAGGMLIETPSLPPLGTEVCVRFRVPDSDASLVARAEVKNHYVFNYHEGGGLRWARGIGVRFLEFLADTGDAHLELGEQLQRQRTRMRTLH
jgi:hypothetical protein